MSDSLSVEEVLLRNGVWTSTVVGNSMSPMLRDKQDIVVIEPKPDKEKLKKYDVVLIRRDGKLVLHRIVKVKKDGFLFVGDNAYYKENISYEQIIGILTEFGSGAKLKQVTSKKYKIYAFFRVKTYYIRLLLHKIKLRLKGKNGNK